MGLSRLLVECCLVLGACLRAGTVGLFSDSEFRLLLAIRDDYNVGFLIIVEDAPPSPPTLAELKRISGRNLAVTCLSSEQLWEVLASRRDRMWRTKTMLVTRERIPLGSYLDLVQNQKLMVWVLFAEPEDLLSGGGKIPHNARALYVKRAEDGLVVYQLQRSFNGEPEMIIRKLALSHLNEGEYEREKNLSDVAFRISADVCEPNRFQQVLPEFINCFHLTVLDIISRRLGFRVEISFPTGFIHPFVTPSGTYAGFFKMVLDKEVNMSIASFVITEKRLEVLDFIWPTLMVETMLYVKKADAMSGLYSGTPFANSVWMVMSVWVIVMGCCLHLAVGSDPVVPSQPPFRSFFFSILEIARLACNQGISENLSTIPTRILCSATLFGGMLLYFYYSAMVLSYLTFENVVLPFSNIEELVERGIYRITAVKGGFPLYFIKFEMKHRARRRLLRQDKLPSDLTHGITQLCEGKFLTLLELRGFIMNAESFDCDLLEIPSSVFDENFGFAVTKGFPFSEQFNFELWRLYEVGIIEKTERDLLKQHHRSGLQGTADEENKTVTIEQVLHLVIILNVGFAASLILFFFEMVEHAKRRDRHSPPPGALRRRDIHLRQKCSL
ncbi:UNVERIFIED_CONTAM: hypothetical protein PYX00_004104 [Menopon gallinae]|uniref:Ionotropic glutamate receptor C-terminal domain-containing protein n=1 Tax=Menopon gallinae TaxID=328185 RepID=A0AAW2I408_9NEOP